MSAVGLAESYTDPTAKIQAQDEAVYSSTVLAMVRDNQWLTPEFLGRYALYKPPMVYWASAVCVKALGPTLRALRLPSLLAGSAVITLLFFWAWRAYHIWAACGLALLLVSDRIFHLLARLVLTDMLLMLCIVVALWAARRSVWVVGIAVGLAILTKGVAGFLPLMIVAAAGTVRLGSFARMCCVAAVVAAPWHIYHLVVHTRWFWAEYILTEHFTWALAAPSQSTEENQLLYYIRRMWVLDPLLCLAALIGIPTAVWSRNRLVACWIGVVLLAFVGFGYRNTTYLLLIVVPMAFLAAPIFAGWRAVALMAILAAIRISYLPYHAEHAMPSVDALKSYAGLRRGRELILVDPDDQFVSSTLALGPVRYCFFSRNPDPPPLPLDFRYLGVTLTVPEFNNLDALLPRFQARLAEFGMPSTAAVGTVVLARSVAEVGQLLAAHQEADFWLPAGLSVPASNRVGWNPNSGTRVFLLAR